LQNAGFPQKPSLRSNDYTSIMIVRFHFYAGTLEKIFTNFSLPLAAADIDRKAGIVTMLISHSYPEAYIRFLAEYHGTRDYFECHEILEEHWKKHADDPLAELWHGLIQIAVGQYHLRRGNREGARKMLRSAWDRLPEPLLNEAGLDGAMLRAWLDEAASLLERGEGIPYTGWVLPIRDQELLAACKERCAADGLEWCGSIRPEMDLIHRHLTRDRTEVVQAREDSLRMKSGASFRNNG
jgi:hypothetical protein